jgi:hypothetical protein
MSETLRNMGSIKSRAEENNKVKEWFAVDKINVKNNDY